MAMASGTIAAMAAMAAQMATPWRCGWWWRLVVLLGWALEGNIGNTREHFKSSPCIPCTNASVKSYQLVKVVSGGRAPGKSSSLASPQLLVFHVFHGNT